MKALYITTAVVEVGTGLALLGAPSLVVELLLGVPLDSPASIVLGRITGTALLALGATCWFAREDEANRVGRGLIAAMMLYNGMASALLAYAGIHGGMVGIAFWPAVALHVIMAAWCVVFLKQALSRDSLKHEAERNRSLS